MSDGAEWRQVTVERVGRAVQQLRGKRSAQWLADRTAELGAPISRAAISNLENGRKTTVDLADMLVIAAALKVPPVRLLFPDHVNEQVEVLPYVSVQTMDAVTWFSGEDYFKSAYEPKIPKHLARDINTDIKEYEENARMLTKARTLNWARGDLAAARKQMNRAVERADFSEGEFFAHTVNRLEEIIRSLIEEIDAMKDVER